VTDKKSIQTIKTDIPVTREIIRFGRNRVREVEKATGRTPKQLLRVVETLEEEYNGRKSSVHRHTESHTSVNRKKTKPGKHR
jgi:hypothetical protein